MRGISSTMVFWQHATAAADLRSTVDGCSYLEPLLDRLTREYR